MRQHEAHCLAVDDTGGCRERIGQGVGRAEHRVFNREPGPGGAELHGLTGGHIAAVGKDLGQVVREQPPGLPREDSRRGRCGPAHMALDRMRHRIDARERGHSRWLREGEMHVEDRDAEGGPWVAAGHLHAGRRIGDEGE